MQNNYQIVWEKWIDPFGEDIEETQWGSYDDDDEDLDTLSTQKEIFKNQTKPIKVISSPMGLIPYNEHTSSGKIFNFWVGHTNFNISKGVVDIVENCEGVEILDVFTRYRFRIAIAKCFNDNEVMIMIKNEISNFLNRKNNNDIEQKHNN